MRALPASPPTARRALVLVCAAVLAGCASSSPAGNGIASRTPAQIVALAKAAAAGAATVHVAGSIVGAGKPISINMELVAGKGGTGRVALEGLSVELVNVDHALYVKGSSAFYGRIAGPRAARALDGRWLKGSVDSAAMAPLASLTRLNELLGSTLAGHATLTRGAQATVDGQKAVAVEDPENGGTLYVAATGQPYPLEITTNSVGGGRVVFDRWNQSVTLAPPTGAINIKQLHSGR
jgi:hypothetical protein